MSLLHRCAVATLGLGLAACAHQHVIPPDDPPVPPPFDETAAQAKLQGALDMLATAQADGSLSPTECESLAQAFTALHQPLEPRTANAAFNVGVVWERCGNPTRAATAYRLAIQTEPKHSPSHNNLGVLHWAAGDHDQALASFRLSVKADTNNPAPRNNLASAMRERYISSGSTADFETAEKALRTALAVDSDNPLAYENLARLYYDRGRTQDRSYLLLAKLVITQGGRILTEAGQQSAELHNLHGLLLMEEDDQVAALRAFKQATTVDPEHPEAHLNIAMIALRFRDYPTAQTSLEQALADEGHSDDVTAMLGLGVAQRGQRRYDEAAQTLTRAHEIDAKDPRALYNLGILYHEHIGPNDSQVEDEQGEFVFDATPFLEARRFFERFAKAAGDRYPKEVADARTRVASIDQFLQDNKDLEILKEEQAKAEAQARREQQEERKRLLEIEKRAKQAAEAAGT